MLDGRCERLLITMPPALRADLETVEQDAQIARMRATGMGFPTSGGLSQLASATGDD